MKFQNRMNSSCAFLRHNFVVLFKYWSFSTVVLQYQYQGFGIVFQYKTARLVHPWRGHGENFECVLCELNAEDLESLDTHLLTCEVYKCNKCGNVFKNLQDLKQHSQENETHKTTTNIKQSREDKNSYDSISYRYDKLFQI